MKKSYNLMMPPSVNELRRFGSTPTIMFLAEWSNDEFIKGNIGKAGRIYRAALKTERRATI